MGSENLKSNKITGINDVSGKEIDSRKKAKPTCNETKKKKKSNPLPLRDIKNIFSDEHKIKFIP